ncbi:MAG: cation:proton antiporter family protein [Arenicellales bacterium]
METLFSSIDYSDTIWVAIALAFGFLSQVVGLPPLVGFLVAGFTLNYFGAEEGEVLTVMADLGVTLLLFTIGLKLRVKDLLRTEVWGVTSIHIIAVSILLAIYLALLKKLGLPLFNELDLANVLIIGFALSFSSTVFVVKVLENRGDMLSHYGRLAIGVLIIKDIAAVIFLGVSEAMVPSMWAAFLITLIIIGRPLLNKLLDKIGHGELLVLYGLVLALGGAALFEAVDMKGDLGAVVFGVLLANNPKSAEMARILFSLKELFLVGFFLSIGMAGLPDFPIIMAVALLLLGLALKSGLFFLLFSRFRVRSRTATTSSLLLGNYSEFGLIVAMAAVSEQWLSHDWLVTIAVLVASSFAISSAINKHADDIYTRFRRPLKRVQRDQRLPGDEDIDLSGTRILVCGMGRVGSGAFSYLMDHGEEGLLGLDFDDQAVAKQNAKGRKTYHANCSSPDFWSRLDSKNANFEWVLLCMPNIQAKVATAKMARKWGYNHLICATSKFPDEEAILKKAGVDAVFNIYAEAGVGLAQNVQRICNVTGKS